MVKLWNVYSRSRERNDKMNLNNIEMSIKFECPNCKKTKLIPQKDFKNMTDKDFKSGKFFYCPKCKIIKMNPVSVEVDY